MVKGINIARVARLIRCRARHRKRGFAQRGAGECQDTSGAGRDSGTLRLRQRLSFLSAKLGPPRASPRVVGLGRRLVCILHRAGRVRQALRIARLPCPRDRSAPAASYVYAYCTEPAAFARPSGSPAPQSSMSSPLHSGASQCCPLAARAVTACPALAIAVPGVPRAAPLAGCPLRPPRWRSTLNDQSARGGCS